MLVFCSDMFILHKWITHGHTKTHKKEAKQALLMFFYCKMWTALCPWFFMKSNVFAVKAGIFYGSDVLLNITALEKSLGFWSLLYAWSLGGIIEDYQKHTLLCEFIKRSWKCKATQCRFYAAWKSISAWDYDTCCNMCSFQVGFICSELTEDALSGFF